MFLYKYFSYFINPLPVILLLLSVGFLCSKNTKCRIATNTLALVLYISVSTPFLPRAMFHALENTYPVFDSANWTDKGDSIHIMVLGAGYGYESRFQATNQLNTTSLGRLVEGVRIYKYMSKAKLILSAGTVSQPFTHAQISAEAALALGVPTQDTIQLNTALNTIQEASSYVSRFGTNNTLILVTNASHMPRAMYLFNKYGIDPIPAPTNHKIRKTYAFNLLSYFPSSGAISMMEKAWHEYLGLWYAKYFL